MLKEALLYKKLENKKVACFLCNHYCVISDGRFGVCGVRQNKNGILYTYAYGGVVSAAIDPIEKKPLFHFLPGTDSFSIATFGCNFHCDFCQNWQISQKKEADKLDVSLKEMSSGEVIRRAQENKCPSISYTYTEPTIFFEYALEIAMKAREKGLFNIFVTNGYMSKEALDIIYPTLDAANVDLKFFRDENYRKVCGGKLEPVLQTIRLMRKLKIWVEVTTLVIPGQNDSAQELKDIAYFIAQTGAEIPWHISRAHPDYRMVGFNPTSEDKLQEAYEIGKRAGLRYVYIGNVAREEKTSCYSCGKDLIIRAGFSVLENKIQDSKCSYCGVIIDGEFAK